MTERRFQEWEGEERNREVAWARESARESVQGFGKPLITCSFVVTRRMYFPVVAVRACMRLDYRGGRRGRPSTMEVEHDWRAFTHKRIRIVRSDAAGMTPFRLEGEE